MALNYFRPSAILRDHVSFLYVFDTETASFHGTLPAMLGQVRLTLAGSISFRHCGDRYNLGLAPASPTMITGPSHGVTKIVAGERLITVGAGLLPLG